MKALLVKRYGMAPVLTEMPLPTLDTSHALIKMKYAPVNPSDLNFYLGSYGLRKEDHPIVGFEGSGVVIESSNHSLVDSCVSVTSNMTNGTFATHIVCSES